MRITTMKRWSPRLAQRFCERRLARIEHLLTEIGAAWGDVNYSVEYEVEENREGP